MSEEILWKQTGLRIIREVGDNYIEIEEIHYPLEHLGWYNKYREVVRLSDKIVTCETIRDSWGGSGSEQTCYVELTNEEAAKLREMMLSAETPEDFDKIKDYIAELSEKYEEEWDGVVEELIEELMQFDFVQEKIATARDPELREKLIEYLKEKIEDYFTE
jgi:hypothetical protein